ncbi:hypothetical protein RHSIM_Rhsim13G0082000 [Rhododendron simsii]|uniref:Uncharacterized protein n=1 Tax=Rhododendron simsii TaxID=118357 RepID=A0A834FYS4_RHOSS|nr:hypothetical protein RHSIM_Rhsim13G0082000 [Rhododendron simsii]
MAEMSKVTVTQMLEYGLREQGVDVGDITRDESLMLPVRPISLDSPCILEWVGGFSKLALDEHNKNKSTNYQFVKVLKANIAGNYSRLYYITFEVKDMARSGSPTLNFQATVKTF